MIGSFVKILVLICSEEYSDINDHYFLLEAK